MKLEALVEKIVARDGVPGLAIGVVHDDEVAYLKGFGQREVTAPETIGADTAFQIASFSKPVSSTVVAVLVSESVVGSDSRIVDLDPGFRLAEP
jgi:CubicO group peptidase (beta-lactamase class C family)